MTKIIAYEFLSIDGKFEGPQGQEMDFVQKGFCEAIEQDIARQYASLSAFIMGRKTFDSLARYWPTDAARHETLFDHMNAMTKLVVSNRADVSNWAQSSHLSADPFAALEERKRSSKGDMMVIGSATVVRELLRRGMIDEFRLLLFPTVLGAGTDLFPGGTAPSEFELVASRAYNTGAMALDYAVRA
ncbi:MAG: dihydrofolate reductase family protein [Pelagibacterium sp.]|jgi:dihydrofolate reductase|uniref:dihydrofolate reductase family protein n=1 Tax=Pelagibacterium sp. TaxID=1967288 RepID=UPI0032EB0352|tara:strand:- start:25077 stop:25637 length:561 start_codon:yes stop_codon:yes gene_type:complete